MFPNWHDDIRIPTVGDDVSVGDHLIRVDCNRLGPAGFRVAVQPRTETGVLAEHAWAIVALLENTHHDAAQLLDQYVQSNIQPAKMNRLRVDLKNLLENYRSALEYVAHYVAEVCTPRPPRRRVQFPIADSSDTASTFAQKLDRWFPGLGRNAPQVRDYLLSIQEFSGELWLRRLADLVNFNKHRSLSAQEVGVFYSTVVRFGDAGIRFGELGLRSLSLAKGGTLRFINSAGQEADLVGPCTLDASTTSLPGAAPGIEVAREIRQLYRIPGHRESIVGMLWSIDKNVFRTVDRICALLSQR